VPELPGHLLLIFGILIMGWNMARYGALLTGEVVTSDVVSFALSQIAVLVVYVGLLLVLMPRDANWLERALPLLLAAMTTHALIDARVHALDSLIYGPALSAVRQRLRRLSRRASRQADPVTVLVDVREGVDELVRAHDDPARQVTEPAFELRLQVESALRHLNDLPGLSQYSLVNQLLGADGTALESAAVLRSELEQAIERLRPTGPRPTPGSVSGPGGWLHYLVLREPYIDGRPNKQVIQRYCLSEGTFHRARRRAIDALTLDLHERASHRATPALSRQG
jgi:hypothetical protein